MDLTLLITVKVSECKLEPFERAQSMCKLLAGSIYVDNIVNYFSYLTTPFPRGLQVDLERSSTFGEPTSIWCTVYPLVRIV